MRRLLLRRNLRLFCRSVLRFIDRSACRAMGCFFDCFRARDDRSTSNLASHSPRVESRRGAASQNRLSALFLSEEKAVSPYPDKQGAGLDSIHIDRGLKDEAKFLKACGTIPETPIEIRKASKKSDASQHDRDSGSPDFQSWLPNNSTMKFNSGEKIDGNPTPLKTCEELGRESVNSQQTPSSCMTSVHISGRFSSDSSDADEEGQQSISTCSAFSDDVDRTGKAVLTDSQRFSLGNMQGRTKSVRFDCAFDKVAEESDESLQAAKTQAPSEQIESETPKAQEIHGNNQVEESSNEWVSKAEASFSPWLKQSNENNNENSGALSAKTPRFAITPSDRPIIGMVAAHWNKEELTQISPKWWDGNGIPNSTNKYKEDQKVSWHATPFEERLEKALSEEGFICQRRHYDGNGVVMEETEGDTAISQLQHSPQTKSVVSF